MKLNYKKKYQAFSLIEMVVSLGVIMFISVIFIANYRVGNRRTDLIMTAQNLVADLHAVQNKALGLTKYGNNVPAGGWGINFNKGAGTYTVFADLNEPDSSGYLEMDETSETERSLGAREVVFSGEIKIGEMKVFNGISSVLTDELNITFLPPDPLTNIFNVTTKATGTAATIELKELGSEAKKKIRINFLGLIEVIE